MEKDAPSGSRWDKFKRNVKTKVGSAALLSKPMFCNHFAFDKKSGKQLKLEATAIHIGSSNRCFIFLTHKEKGKESLKKLHNLWFLSPPLSGILNALNLYFSKFSSH